MHLIKEALVLWRSHCALASGSHGLVLGSFHEDARRTIDYLSLI